MLSPWLNQQVTVQRRATNPARNTLNEPNYGKEGTWPTIYSNIWVRIEYVPETAQWMPTGERVNPSPSGTFMYFEPAYVILPQDRVTVTLSDDPSLISKLYIVIAYFSEWDSMGNVHHEVVQLAVH